MAWSADSSGRRQSSSDWVRDMPRLVARQVMAGRWTVQSAPERRRDIDCGLRVGGSAVGGLLKSRVCQWKVERCLALDVS